MRAWYLIFSKPQRERLALDNLERQGYVVYLPLLRRRKRVGSQYRRVVEAMFPRYLFVQLDDEKDDWGPIRSTIGVANMVRFGMTPARVPNALLRHLRESEDEHGIQHVPDQALKAGDPVRIVEGVLAGYEAIYHSQSSKERVILLLEIAERSAKITLNQNDIETIAEPCKAARRRI